MAADKSTLQSILENIRDAAIAFGHRFAPAGNIPGELEKLLAELGINDPGRSVSSALAGAAAGWKTLADSLSAVSLDFTDPAAVLAGICLLAAGLPARRASRIDPAKVLREG